MAPVKVVLAGAQGHGQHHLRNLRRLTGLGVVELAGICDLRPVEVDFAAPPQSSDLGELVEKTGAEITIVCTPIHTHADLAVTALRAGSHVLLEKPPAATPEAHRRIAEAAARTGRACQVGFQSLGSAAVPALRELIANGTLGKVRGIGGAGAWVRPAAYFTRSPWAGRRRLDDVDVVDGALTNPFAHAVATALALADGPIARIETELYHAFPIESDDTSCVRIRLADGLVITIAVTLCAKERHEPYLVVHGERGTATLVYTEDRLTVELADGSRTTTVYERTDLLENLADHVRTGADLLVPLPATETFTQVLDAVRLAPEPVPIPERHQVVERDAAGEVVGRLLPGVAELTARSARELTLYSELGAPWTRVELLVAGEPVAAYDWRPDLPATDSPRPYLHHVRTRGGVEVTEVRPPDHVHHLGVGVAISDLGGANFWGGRTYVKDRGPTWLDDHGTQRHVAFSRLADDGFTEHLEWIGPGGRPMAREERTVAARPVGDAWALDFAFTLTNLTGAPLTVQSSATKGRPGAGYGGFFWRAPGTSTARTTLPGDERAVHGSRGRWVAMSGTTPQGRDWTLIFVQADGDPWFVRVAEYPGVGQALAWDAPLVVKTTLTRRVVTIVADGRLDEEEVSALAADVRL
ncbi:dehydrogenase [Nonomuraea terrae]|uniref:Dehydrogenase n=1 Tax=Nonomuraea terrae TaxID=2530383 RepID=A0A4V2YMA7_9ACTN|nr:dehydrogenase [Nonomuraea terrae]